MNSENRAQWSNDLQVLARGKGDADQGEVDVPLPINVVCSSDKHGALLTSSKRVPHTNSVGGVQTDD